MSTDLQFPSIRLQPIKIHSPPQSSSDIIDDNTNTAAGIIQSPESSSSSVDFHGNQEECRTPTSDEHKIPDILNCPPAPRKPRHAVISCKRKLSELKFFDVEHREEVDAFFRSSFELVTAAAAATKRRCPCK